MGRNTSSGLPAAQNKCVFCGGTDLSETLIWPTWLDQIIAKDSYRRIDGETGAPIDGPDQPYDRCGDLRTPLSQRPRLACAACNAGWISKLGDDVREFLVPALTGGKVALTPDRAKALAGWLCLLAINAAFLSSHCGISPADRSYLRHTGQPPKNWTIFMAGLSESGWCKACKHHPYRIEFSGNPMTTHSRSMPIMDCNTQLLSFGMGPLFFHIFSSPSLVLQSEFTATSKAQGLAQLWPQERRFGLLPLRPISIPPALKLTDAQAWDVTDRIADLLQRRLPARAAMRSAALEAVD